MELTASKTASCTMAAYRAWAIGVWPFATAVSTAIAFQSRTASAFATAAPNSKVAINMHKQEVLFPARPRILFIVLPPHSLLSLSVTGILVAEGLLVHTEARVGVLCFVSG
jgi:hypothetical protein